MAIKSPTVKVAVIYRKEDGKIVRATTLTPHLLKQMKEDNIRVFLPGVDTSQFGMVFVQGKQFFDIEKYRVEVDARGRYKGIVENEEILTSVVDSEAEVTDGLLDRDAHIVISVLSIIDDKNRLAKYKELELRGRNRTEVLNFFKQKGL